MNLLPLKTIIRKNERKIYLKIIWIDIKSILKQNCFYIFFSSLLKKSIDESQRLSQ